MEKQKERLEVLTQMTEQITAVGRKLNQMQVLNAYGELDPILYSEYKTELNRYAELDERLQSLTGDINASDKSEVQTQPIQGAYPGDHSPPQD